MAFSIVCQSRDMFWHILRFVDAKTIYYARQFRHFREYSEYENIIFDSNFEKLRHFSSESIRNYPTKCIIFGSICECKIQNNIICSHTDYSHHLYRTSARLSQLKIPVSEDVHLNTLFWIREIIHPLHKWKSVGILNNEIKDLQYIALLENATRVIIWDDIYHKAMEILKNTPLKCFVIEVRSAQIESLRQLNAPDLNIIKVFGYDLELYSGIGYVRRLIQSWHPQCKIEFYKRPYWLCDLEEV